MAVTLVVWLGIFAYLWVLDRKVRRLEREVRREHGRGADR
jgi:CcmD family protein